MRNFIKAGALMLCLGAANIATAQTDPHFSQYYAYPLWLNPALTGAIDGDYRVTAIYRDQWGSAGAPFRTPGVSADVVTDKNVSLGINLMNQSTGSGGYNYLNGYASMSYTGIRFGKNGNQHISLGISMGLINRHFDQSKFKTGEQFNPSTGAYDPSMTGSETYSKTSSTVFDAGAGAMYFDATPGKKANVFLGFSAFHLTQPKDPFIATGTAEKMPVRLTAHGGVKLNLSENVSFTPNLLYMRQGNAEEKMAGAYAQLKVNEAADFMLGANYRFDDAISPYVGFYYKNFVLGASYDINNSDLGKMGGNANSFEISLTIIGRKSAKADPIPFVCPRF